MHQFKIYAHPDLNSAVAGKVVNGHKPPVEVGEASSMEVAATMILSWVCRNKFAGSGKSPFATNTDTFICNVWEFEAPSGERWYIVAHQQLEGPINQEVNS